MLKRLNVNDGDDEVTIFLMGIDSFLKKELRIFYKGSFNNYLRKQVEVGRWSLVVDGKWPNFIYCFCLLRVGRGVKND